jgi:uncharacterized protein
MGSQGARWISAHRWPPAFPGAAQLSFREFSRKDIGNNSLPWYKTVMNRSEAIARLREHEPEPKRLGVQHLYLFGSTASGNAREDSDVDLFFDYEEGKLGLFQLMEVKEVAARILGRKTDIMTRDSIHRLLRERIEAAAVPVF